MIKVYSMTTCPDCIYVHSQIKDNPNFEIVDIGSHVMYLKEFLKLRDSNDAFKQARENNSIGIPCFLREDGIVTLSAEDVGLKSKPKDEVMTCSIKGGC